jgi:hypothetical protein
MADEKIHGRSGGGDSGGGAYPDPRKGKDDGTSDGYMGHGGQSEMPYHGKGRLGEEKVGENANAPTEETGASDD